MSKKTQHLNMTLYCPQLDENGRAVLDSDANIPLSWQSSDSTIKDFQKGVAEVAKLANTLDENGNPVIEPGVPFAVWCVFDERTPKAAPVHTGRQIMRADGTTVTVGSSPAPATEAEEVPFRKS